MTEVSEDIFFQVKKEILDKLDIILQKLNLEIINYIKPEEAQFKFIQLASFQEEITHLFGYLDRLYASLNSSVSFSSIKSFKESAEQYQAENQRLIFENQQLRKMIEQISQSSLEKGSVNKLSSQIEYIHELRNDLYAKIEPLRVQVKRMMSQFGFLAKYLKKQLKSYKFQMLEMRVEVISKLKDWQHCKQQSRTEMDVDMISNMHCKHEDHTRDTQEILDSINNILSIC